MDLITRSILVYLISFMVVTLQNSQNSKRIENRNRITTAPTEVPLRGKRGFIITKTKPGPLRQIFSVFYEQWNDTRFTTNNLNRILNDQFLPENASLITSTTPTANTNVSTKPPPYKVTRSELIRILRRNLKGLVRLYNIEFKDAIKQSEINSREHKQNVTKEVAKFL
ncbi:hypothetical protein FQA39_LY14938 [Lamprigera yunnana]|nr:hypothetical protein FQA39_LY14938 [Lamprigera yunnana]